MSNFSFTRPADPAPVLEREAVAGECPACGAAALARYPVLSEGGWFMAVKCQQCLHSVSREKWHRLGYVQLITDSL
ncbi:MAG: hypothetical protein ACU85V_02755 [Gammaproteobacteria bacterium]